jgi:hypothetical protein
MAVRPSRREVRPTAQAPRTQQSYTWQAPTRGLVVNGSLATTQVGTAALIENWWPTATGITMRRGCEKHNELAELPVKTIFSYISGSNRQMFASDDENIYDITVSSTSTDVYECTSGNWIVAQYQSSSGDTYLRGVNGEDTPFIYDGTTFDTTPAITFPSGSTVTANDLNYTWVYKNRFFFIQKNSLDVWYLDVGELGGEADIFSLGGIFKLGGSLIMGATWSRDTGSGMNAMCAFFSSEGEVAIYQGDNPSEAESWSLVGVFRIGRPKGPRSIMDAGGDLIVATDNGMIPLSTALEKDFSILSNEALSGDIVDLWNSEATSRVEQSWNVSFWSTRQMVVVALPAEIDKPSIWLACNARTRAWTKFTGWKATCVHVFRDRLFFGDEKGFIYESDVSGMDNGKPYTCSVVPNFDQMGVMGVKAVHMLRPVFRGPNTVVYQINVLSDFYLDMPTPPQAPSVIGASVWGEAVWGVDEWSAGDTERVITQNWINSFGWGEVHSPVIQITSGSVLPMDAELIRIDAVFTSGDMVV